MKAVAYTSAARRQLKKLSDVAQAQVRADIAVYARTGAADILKLKGRTNAWRLRSGDYRIVVALDADTITVEGVGDRKDIYR